MSLVKYQGKVIRKIPFFTGVRTAANTGFSIYHATWDLHLRPTYHANSRAASCSQGRNLETASLKSLAT